MTGSNHGLKGEAMSLVEARTPVQGPPRLIKPVGYLGYGPGWLDDDTPCACDRLVLMQAGRVFSDHLIEDLISRPPGPVVCTFDPKDQVTKVQ